MHISSKSSSESVSVHNLSTGVFRWKVQSRSISDIIKRNCLNRTEQSGVMLREGLWPRFYSPKKAHKTLLCFHSDAVKSWHLHMLASTHYSTWDSCEVTVTTWTHGYNANTHLSYDNRLSINTCMLEVAALTFLSSQTTLTMNCT